MKGRDTSAEMFGIGCHRRGGDHLPAQAASGAGQR